MRIASRCLRLALVILIAVIVVAPVAIPAQVAKSKAGELPKFTANREAAAREFVRRNHPELDPLLDKLRAMNAAEYEKVIRELSRTIEALAALQARDPARHELALEAWKAKSRVERLAAQHSRSRSNESESALRQALENQLDVELTQRQFERDALTARLKKMNEQIGRLEDDRSGQIEMRLRRLTKGRTVAKAKTTESSGPGKDSPKRNANP